MSLQDQTPRTVGRWRIEVIGEDHEWHSVGGGWGTPTPMTGSEAIAKTLATHGEEKARWARAFCMPSNLGSWYDLHYPAGVEPVPPRERQGALGPHLWVPAPEAYYLAGLRHQSYAADTALDEIQRRTEEDRT